MNLEHKVADIVAASPDCVGGVALWPASESGTMVGLLDTKMNFIAGSAQFAPADLLEDSLILLRLKADALQRERERLAEEDYLANHLNERQLFNGACAGEKI